LELINVAFVPFILPVKVTDCREPGLKLFNLVLIDESTDALTLSSVETLVVKEVSAEDRVLSSVEILVVREASADDLVEVSVDILESIDVSFASKEAKDEVRPEMSA
jgi:hypothetical protein